MKRLGALWLGVACVALVSAPPASAHTLTKKKARAALKAVAAEVAPTVAPAIAAKLHNRQVRRRPLRDHEEGPSSGMRSHLHHPGRLDGRDRMCARRPRPVQEQDVQGAEGLGRQRGALPLPGGAWVMMVWAARAR